MAEAAARCLSKIQTLENCMLCVIQAAGGGGGLRETASSTSSRGELLALLLTVGTWILLAGEACTPDLNKGKEAH